MRSDLVLSGILTLLLIVFLNPMNIFMPPMVVMVLLIILIVFFSLFAALIWKEAPKDEREAVLSQKAGRIAFLIGTSVLVIGIVYQEMSHALDPWLIYVLVAMILGKTLGYMYAQYKS